MYGWAILYRASTVARSAFSWAMSRRRREIPAAPLFSSTRRHSRSSLSRESARRTACRSPSSSGSSFLNGWPMFSLSSVTPSRCSCSLQLRFLSRVVFVQGLVARSEHLVNSLPALRKLKRSPGFERARIQNDDLVFDGRDLLGHPALGVLAVEEDMQERIDGPQLGEEEEGHHGGAADRQPETDPIAPRKLHQANEILHVRGMSQTGLPREPPCVIGL